MVSPASQISAGRYPVHNSAKTEQAGHGKEHERRGGKDALVGRAWFRNGFNPKRCLWGLSRGHEQASERGVDRAE